MPGTVFCAEGQATSRRETSQAVQRSLAGARCGTMSGMSDDDAPADEATTDRDAALAVRLRQMITDAEGYARRVRAGASSTEQAAYAFSHLRLEVGVLADELAGVPPPTAEDIEHLSHCVMFMLRGLRR